MVRRGKEGRWFDVLVYLAAAVAVLFLARVLDNGALAVAALIPFGFAVWRANAD